MKKIIITLLALVSISPAAFSQILRSTTFTKPAKEKGKTEWFVRLGLSCNTLTGAAKSECNKELKEENEDDGAYSKYKFKPRVSYDISSGFNKYFGKSNVYWGMELGLGTRGGSFTGNFENDSEKFRETCYVNSYNVKYTPFTIGYKYPIKDDIKIDAHLGFFLSFDFAGKYTVDELHSYGDINDTYKESYDFIEEAEGHRFDVGMHLGIGAWYKRYNLNFTWQRGFLPYLGSFPFGDQWYNKSGDQVYYNSSNIIISIAYAF